MHNRVRYIRRDFRKLEKNLFSLIVSFLFLATFLSIFIPNVAAVDKPDLTIDDFKITSPTGTIRKNDIVEFSVKVKNVGSASLSDSVILALRIDGTLVNSTIISSLGIGSLVTKTLSWRADIIGTHTATAFIDYLGNVDEENEGNNVRGITFTVEERPTDIEVGDIEIYPSIDNIWVNDTVYVNSTITNLGKDASENVVVQFFVNDSKKDEKIIGSTYLEEGESYNVSFEWIPTKPGTYTLKIKVPQVAGESNTGNNVAELDNVRVKSKGVSLRIIDVTSDVSYESGKNNETAVSAGGMVSYKIEIKNTGTVNDSFTITNKSLSGGDNWNINLSRSSFENLSSGGTDVFYANVTSPSDAENNEKAVFEINAKSTTDGNKNVSLTLTITILTDLSVEDIHVYGDLCIAGKTADITTSIINKKAYAKDIGVKIYVDDQPINYTILSSLDKGESGAISIVWNVDANITFGYHVVKVRVDPEGLIPEYNETNNEKSCTVVAMKEPTWWNQSWHYRKIFAVDGINNGNISIEDLNFTEMLVDLGIYGETFDENSVRVVKYSSDGAVLDDSITFNMTKKPGFNNKTNALVNLNISVHGNGIKYYCVYFDVMNNNINQLSKSSYCSSSATGYTTYIGKAEGWEGEIIRPNVTDYFSPNKNINITIRTQALADNVTVEFYKNKIRDDTKTRYLTSNDNLTWYLPDTKPVSFDVGEEGKWVTKAICKDKANYTTAVESFFNIGKPDLTISSIEVLPPQLYEGNKATLKVVIKCADSSVSDIVNVKLEIPEENITQWRTIPNMSKDEEQIVNFSWITSEYGVYNVTVRVDPNGTIIESNEKNNQKTVQINVLGLPDLEITNISIDSLVEEGKPVNATIYVRNKGHAAAEESTIVIYATQGSVLYYSKSEEVSNTTIGNIPKDGEDSEVLPVWSKALYGSPVYRGKWIIGAKIIPSVKDLTPGNNYASTILYVNRSEDNPPDINQIVANDKILYPDNEMLVVELGNNITIVVDATDESGIWNITINLTYPDGTNVLDELTQQSSTSNIWQYEFTPPAEGEYSFYVVVTDASYRRNTRISKTCSFQVTKDVTPPEIKEFHAKEFDWFFERGGGTVWVLLQNKVLTIKARVTDNVEVAQVIANITYPNGYITYVILNPEGNNWYSNNTANLSMLGLYV
ncbi:MAG: hypothetical protein J7K62_01010, partial [Thermoplasmata archaeon]|nr:hypothetical protein [Thermoplasmata archaeon]